MSAVLTLLAGLLLVLVNSGVMVANWRDEVPVIDAVTWSGTAVGLLLFGAGAIGCSS